MKTFPDVTIEGSFFIQAGSMPWASCRFTKVIVHSQIRQLSESYRKNCIVICGYSSWCHEKVEKLAPQNNKVQKPTRIFY